MQITTKRFFALSLLLTTPSHSSAEEDSTTKLDELWGLATLYQNDTNPYLQELKLRGRYQGQYHWLNSDQGNDRDWENRRSRFGFDAKIFDKKIELRLDAQSNDEFSPLYDRLTDAYIKWKPSSDFSLTLGKQKPQIGYYDWLQSTNTQPTFERSQIFNQLGVDRATGAVAEGKVDLWTWQIGIYSNDMDQEFGSLDGGISYGAGLGYNFKDLSGLGKSELRFDWLHSDHDAADAILNRYDDLFSSTLWLKDGRYSLVTEAFYARGNQPDAFGIYVQPTYDIVSKKFQLVGRYSFSIGDGADSLTAQSRYERAAPFISGKGKGERYHAAYLGVQYFIYGDKLKLMSGAEYAHLNGGGNGGDYDGVMFLSGIRFSF
jgi:phosphate-selective porin OprO and OprP